ncbi:MAG: amino acid decarboxylase, partial [Anaerolineae bacterium]|nr:amino acid decarboxylase [Anaerolineae bacterium]
MIDLSPDEFRRLGYRAIDLIAERMAAQESLPVRQPVPEALREQLMNAPLPMQEQAPDELLDAIANLILPYPMGNASSRFFAWVNSPPAPMGILGELLAAAHNASSAGGDHAATYVEHGVLNWIKDIIGYPRVAGGILTSGGSTANLIALAVMRHVKTQGVVRAQGFNGETAPMTIYTSTQGHSCIEKAVELLGFGHDYLRKIPTDGHYQMRVDLLRERILADLTAGLRPVCVAASAGTVNTGAIDPLDALADVCAEFGLWFHVDGAYGGVGILATQVRDHYRGMERADSIATDPHKWLYA